MGSIVQDIRDSIEQAGLTERLTVAHIAVVMGTALLCAIIIYLVYRIFYRGAVYRESFNLLIVLTCMTTAFIIMTISTNLILSLGMVGALSIVRFRSAIKDPLDIGFLFWAISAGITAGAGLYPLALIGTVFISIIYIVFLTICKGHRSYLLVIRYENSAEKFVNSQLSTQKGHIKSIIQYKEYRELTMQLKYQKDQPTLLAKLLKNTGVKHAVLMEYVGD